MAGGGRWRRTRFGRTRGGERGRQRGEVEDEEDEGGVAWRKTRGRGIGGKKNLR